MRLANKIAIVVGAWTKGMAKAWVPAPPHRYGGAVGG